MSSFGHEKEPAVQSAIIPLWEKQARQWARVRPPLRPSAPDLVFAQDEIDRQAALVGQLNAVILGVTPELLDLRWPASARVLAVDLSGSMIRGLWRANLNQRQCRWPVQGDWLHLPIRRGTVDLVLGDGCFGFFPTGRENFKESVHSALKPGGTWLVRVFMRPDIGESPEQVWEELMARPIGNFHIFKFRLLAALADRDGSVPVARAWDCVHKWSPSLDQLAQSLGWPVEEVQTLEAYRGQSAVYWLPTIEQFRDVMRSHFDEVACHVPNYETGERYPTFVFHSR